MSFPLIVMTTYNRLEYTKRSLAALELTASSFHCVVVDNGSRPETVAYLRQWCQRETPFGGRFDVCLLDKNYGVGKAVNYGMRKRLPGQHVMKLDNDIILPTVQHAKNTALNDRWLDQTLDLLENNKEGLSHVGFSTYKPAFINEHAHDLRYETLTTTTGNQHKVMFYLGETVLGAGVIYHSDVVDELGLFSEDTVYGWEDNKYSQRAHRYGRGVYLLDVQVEHIGDVNPPEDAAEMGQIKHESLAGNMRPPEGEVKERQ